MTDPTAILREPFAPEQVGKLPRVTCRNCSQSKTKNCDKHSKAKCPGCGGYLTTAHIHLDYVGHAAVTQRLLNADPEWTWEPLALDDTGVPVVRVDNGEATMWVRLTVNGVTRIGVGTAPAGSFELHKQLISDAIRNVAMRFGVALDLWSKEPLPEVIEGSHNTTSKPAGDGGGPPRPPSPALPVPGGESPATLTPVSGDPGAVEQMASGADVAATGPDSAGEPPDATGVARPRPPSAPTGSHTEAPEWFAGANRRARAIAKSVLGDSKDGEYKARWEALVWAASGGVTTESKALTKEQHSAFVTRLVDVSSGRASIVESDDPKWLGFTLEYREAS